jgi:hypothetical protein
MKRMLWAAMFLVAGFGAFAQVSGGYLEIMPGATLNQETQTLYKSSWFKREREFNRGFIGSVEGGFSLSRHLGLHFAYVGTKERFSENAYYYGYLQSESRGSLPLNIIELGPELIWRPTEEIHLFLQINLGHTFSSGTASYDSGWSWYHSRGDDWALGLAAGFRFFPSKNAGGCVQITYHHISGWPVSTIWAVQTGLVFRF